MTAISRAAADELDARMPNLRWRMDPRLESFIVIAEVERGDRFVADLFARKFAGTPPKSGHHFIAFYKRPDGAYAPASYLHLWIHDGMGLIGGGSTDGNVIRSMRDPERAALDQAGGLLCQMLGFCFAKFESQCEAFMGHCGDRRAKEVDLRAGFRETSDRYLLIRPNRALAAGEEAAFVERAKAFGLF
jgi:hypothetical protein